MTELELFAVCVTMMKSGQRTILMRDDTIVAVDAELIRLRGEEQAWKREALNGHEVVQLRDAEVERLTKWVNDLQSGMFINCVYCGHRYGPKEDTPVAMADVLKAHIEKCPKHPMSALKSEVERLTKERSEPDPESESESPIEWSEAQESEAQETIHELSLIAQLNHIQKDLLAERKAIGDSVELEVLNLRKLRTRILAGEFAPKGEVK